MNESDCFHGFVDWHSHILPGVDDGIRTLEESLRVLRTFENIGVRKVWLTPHIMEDCPNDTETLRHIFEDLSTAWTGNVQLALASENMLDSLFEERLEKKDLLPIGDDKTCLLVETSYFNPPVNMTDILHHIRERGYFPVLAHPERYTYMNESDYRCLHEDGVLFQLNVLSQTGFYGDTACKKYKWLVKNNMSDFSGSDLHCLDSFSHAINKRISR